MKLFTLKPESFMIPIRGTLLSLSNVPDPVFSQKILGDGFAIEPEGDIAEVIAPLSGTLSVCFPTGHAYGIQTKDGKEILLHLGIDTVELGGEGFTSHVKQGQKLKQGDPLCTINLDVLRSKGKATICPVILTSGHTVTIHNTNQTVDLKEIGAISISQ